MKPLDMREWLEAERLSGMPHADWAAEALAALDELDGLNEADSGVSGDMDEVTDALADCPGKSIVDKAEWAGDQLEKLIEATGAGSIETVLDEATWLNDQFWSVLWPALEAADLVDRNSKARDVDIEGLLAMFLPG